MESDQKDISSLPSGPSSPPQSPSPPSSSVRLNSNHRRSFPVAAGEDDYLFLRVCVPDLNIKKCFQFRKNEKISEIKDQCIASLPLELKQSFNYGLFCPPTGTKCGNFLDENKSLSEYPFSEYSGYLELRFKQRVYKASKIDEKQFKAINSRTNLRRFIDYIRNGQTEKVAKMCAKGLDPNFHCVDSGETPLTLACTLMNAGKIIAALSNGGAFLDFRNLSGSTPLHRAVESNNLEAVSMLLELGTYANVKDCRGLTPLYLSITRKTDVVICEKLLLSKAAIGAQDIQGWQEIHQACRYGLVLHLELLLSYGANINGRNASGNTPLHVCAVNGQENCAKLLLRRGALNDSLNYANQSPYQMAVIAGNLDLAAIIQTYKNSEKDKTPVVDCSDVVSNHSSGIGTTISDFTESNFPLKSPADGCTYLSSSTAAPTHDITNNSPSSPHHQQHQNISAPLLPSLLKARDRFSCCDRVENSSMVTGGIYHRLPRKPTERMTNGSDKHYATAPRQKHKWLSCEPRTVILHKTKRGFGFILRGAKATSSLMDVKTSGGCPALQYLDDVDKGSVADLAGLRKGDYLLAINDEDVSMASHEKVVELIKNSGKLVTMTVISRTNPSHSSCLYETNKCSDGQSKAASTAVGVNAGAAITASSAPRFGYATLPNKLKKHAGSSGGHIVAPLPPRRDPKTTLTVGNWDQQRHHHHPLYHQQSAYWQHQHRRDNCKSPPAESNFRDSQPKTASIRSRPTSSRITAAELEELFQRQAELSPAYREQQQQQQNIEGITNTNRRISEKTELRRNFFSVPDLVQITMCNNADIDADTDISSSPTLSRNHKSQDNVNELEKPLPQTNVEQHSATINTRHSIVSFSSPPPPGMTTALNFGSNCNRNTNLASSIYAVPSDISHHIRPQVKKSASLHSHNSLYGRVLCGNYNGNTDSSSHYHQQEQQQQQGQHHSRYKNAFLGRATKITHRLSSSSSSSSSPPLHLLPPLGPVIPDPDYSQSDEENDQTTTSKTYKTSTLPLPNSRKANAISKLTSYAPNNVTTPVPSANLPVGENHLAPSLLASSSYTTIVSNGIEDGDNSSSGVSSDQEVVPAVSLNNSGSSRDSNGAGSNNVQILPPSSSSPSNKCMTSFAQLPASRSKAIPQRDNVESKQNEFVVLPPPEFVSNGQSSLVPSTDVLEPPPQFSDYGTC